MSGNNVSDIASTQPSAPSRKLVLGGVLFALVYPTIITWAYFVLASRFPAGMQQTIYLVVKSIQFAFPLVWVLFVLREPLRTGRASAQGLLLGAVFSMAVLAGGWTLFDRILRDAPAFEGVSALVLQKIGGFGVDSFWEYAALAGFYAVCHSLLEEYYWRWFAFRQLRRLVRLWPAIVISALAFTAHHVVVLSVFFKDAPWLVALLSSAVAIGGAFWAWLYERTSSLLGPWLSHFLIDAGIFWIGYDLVHSSLAG